MLLSDLLRELREDILNDRSQRVEGDDDHLWTDATLIRYIDDAVKRFARFGLVLRDNTSEATRVTLLTGVTEYTLHPAVLGVLSVKRVGDTQDLARSGHAGFDGYRMPDTVFFDPNALGTLPPGKPVAFGMDETMAADDNASLGAAVLRVYPAPSADYNEDELQLRVVRMPLTDLTTDTLDRHPEIPAEHHRECLDWAAYLALRIVDDEAGSVTRAREFRSSFEEHVARARAHAMRKMFTPLHWGFGRNGFSWES